MIFSKAHLGQTTIEALGSVFILALLLIVGTILILNAFGSVILTRWASKMSHCVAQRDDIPICSHETQLTLSESLAFKKISVYVKKHHGIIHSEIEAHLFERSPLWFVGKFERIKGAYDLEPSEYKRVP